ncbi:hypothetical protein Aperf_G00000038410 [Anoplocephala perfoliata]
MRNLSLLAFTCRNKANTIVNDICVNKHSSELWIATDKGVISENHAGDYNSYLKDKCFSKIAFVNHGYICLQSGNSLILVQLPDQVVCVREFDEIIQDCVFSPDLTLGVVLTGNLPSPVGNFLGTNFVHLVSSEIEVMNHINLTSLSNEKTSFVNVGWGKEETQFKGSKRRNVNADENTPQSTSADIFPGEITWREDSKYFAIAWTDTSGSQVQRRIHIFDKNGDLNSVGFETNGIETGLCWRPRVQLIAVSKRLAGRLLKIIFLELNGLPHGEIDLLTAPECDKFRVGKITFDSVEHIMAVLFLPIDSAPLPFVRLYTTSNYHWSIKGDISPLPIPLPSSPVGHVSFSFGGAIGEVSTCTLHTAVSLGSAGSYLASWSLVSAIDRSAWNSDATSADPAIVAVIDGQSIGFTAFAHTSIPPPMYGSTLRFPFTVSAVSISPPRASGDALSILVQPSDTASNRAPWFLTLTTEWKKNQLLKSGDEVLNQQRGMAANNCTPSATEFWVLRDEALVCADEIASAIFHGQLLHTIWISSEKLCFVSQDGRHLGMLSKVTTNDSVVFEVRRLASLSAANTPIINGLVLGHNEEIAVQTSDGAIRFDNLKALEEAAKSGINTNFDFPESNAIKLPFICNQLCALTFKCQEETSRRSHYLAGLQSSSHRFCLVPWSSTVGVESEYIMRSCSSIALHSDFLLVTSLENRLFTLPLTLGIVEFNSLLVSVKKRLSGSFGGEGSGVGANAVPRALESGARLVTTIARGSKTVLQMPRGNIEDIHPRALVFNQLAPIFDSLHHAQAIETMRRHRINFNLLYDYNPRKFLSNISNFVHQLSSPEHITLLVSDLNEEDITKTEYNGFFGAKQLSPENVLANSASKIRDNLPRPSLIEPQTATKVNLVCEALLKAMLPDTKKFILPILTCYVKKRPQEVEKGLAILKSFRDQGDIDIWERGLRHLQYYLSSVRLFHLALGTYDLELAESLAERTQLDPKEYQPYLAQLRAICSQSVPPNGDADSNLAYQHARIDLLLQRYSSALLGFRSAGKEHWKEFCDVVEKRKLFSEALDLLRPGTPEFSEISSHWADSLVASQQLAAAGEVHLRAGHFDSAARLFLATNLVRLWRLTADRAIAAGSENTLEERKENDASKETLSLETIRSQAQKLIGSLRSLGRFDEAVALYTDYLDDYENAACAAAEGGLWLEAHRLAEHAGDKEEVTVKLKHIALKAHSDFLARLTTDSVEFHKAFDRLIEVRAELRERALNGTTGFGEEIFDDTESELFSDTGSVVSGFSTGSLESSFSKASGRSRKNRRKHERKKWTTKPGSKYEEVALIQALHITITSCQRLCENVRDLVEELWRCGHSDEAIKLARQANTLLLTQRASLNIIWCSEITGVQAPGAIGDEDDILKPTRRYPFHGENLVSPSVSLRLKLRIANNWKV